MEMENLLTAEELAGVLKVKPGTIYKYAIRRVLPSVKVGGALRFRMDKIREYVENHSREPIRREK
jgi:excisionase family DNA binding protein